MAAEMILYYQGILRNLCKMNQRFTNLIKRFIVITILKNSTSQISIKIRLEKPDKLVY